MINWDKIQIMRQVWGNFISNKFNSDIEWDTWEGVFDEKE